MKIVVAPDKFKGSLSAPEAAAAIESGLEKAFSSAEIVKIPIADGGEGTVALISDLVGAKPIQREVTGPNGSRVVAQYGLAERLAVIEMSAASGLTLVPKEQRDPWSATTFGTGELIADALDRGAKEIIIGIGGSATNDGGQGMIDAVGSRIEESADLRIRVACDVDNPLLGPRGCTRIFGPQKGIVHEDFERHEQRLASLAAIFPNFDPETPGAGAAGGLGFGLMAFCAAELCSGFALVADLTGLEKEIRAADLIITGEGRMDRQTLMGKGSAGVADLARAAGKKVIGICGVVEDREKLLKRFDEIVSLEDYAESQQDSINHAGALLELAAQDCGR